VDNKNTFYWDFRQFKRVYNAEAIDRIFEILQEEKISIRGLHVLFNAHIESLAAFKALTKEDLLRMHGCGRKTVEEILSLIAKISEKGEKVSVENDDRSGSHRASDPVQ
jgi:DNA-directed RNA polymerase alpha subunit